MESEVLNYQGFHLSVPTIKTFLRFGAFSHYALFIYMTEVWSLTCTFHCNQEISASSTDFL